MVLTDAIASLTEFLKSSFSLRYFCCLTIGSKYYLCFWIKYAIISSWTPSPTSRRRYFLGTCNFSIWTGPVALSSIYSGIWSLSLTFRAVSTWIRDDFKSWVFTKDPFTLGSTGVMFDLKDECYDSIADDLPAMRL